MSIKGYRYISLPVHESELISHQIYLKEHNDKKNPGRVLFLGNVDVLRFLSIEEVDKLVKGLFKRFGTIEAITLSDISDDARFAHVLFEKKGSLKLALQASDDEYIEIWKELGKKMGLIITASSLQRSVAQVARMYSLKLADCDALKEEVDEYMTAFEGREVQQNLEHKAAAEAVDDDGFQIVSTKKRKREDEDSSKTKQRPRKQKKSTELKNFYRFQIRHDKMKQLDVLRKKFEEDKERVAKMKENRKFKPF